MARRRLEKSLGTASKRLLRRPKMYLRAAFFVASRSFCARNRWPAGVSNNTMVNDMLCPPRILKRNDILDKPRLIAYTSIVRNSTGACNGKQRLEPGDDGRDVRGR